MATIDLGKVVGDSASVNAGTTTTLQAGSSATVENVGSTQNAVFNFGIPRGADGIDGTDGVDGYSPSASVSQSGNITTITITDKDGTTTASIDLSQVGGGFIADEMNEYNQQGTPFVFNGKQKGIYLIGQRTMASTRFYYKKDADGILNSMECYPIFMVIHKTIAEIGTPTQNTFFADLYNVSDGNTNRGLLRNTRFYIDTAGTLRNEVVNLFVYTLAGNQTIGGIKTFSSMPKCSITPTLNEELTNKSYVDGAISTAVGTINTILASLTTPNQGTPDIED